MPTQSVRYDQASLPVAIRTEMRAQSGASATPPQVEYYDGRGEVLQRRTRAQDGRVVVGAWRRFGALGYEAERTPPFSAPGFAFDPTEGGADSRRYRFRHDALGRIVETGTPDGGQSRVDQIAGRVVRHDAGDLDLSAVRKGLGHGDTPRVETLDAKGKLVSVAEDDGAWVATTAYAHDPLGRLLAVTDAEGRRLASYVYDMTGRRIAVDHADARRQRVAFDAIGKPAVLIAADGTRTEVDYDAIGRETEVRAGPLVERFTSYARYQLTGFTGTLDGAPIPRAYAHDRAGNMTANDALGPDPLVTEPGTNRLSGSGARGAVTPLFAYDAVGRMVLSPGRTMTDDARGRLVQVDLSDGTRVAYVYGAEGERVAKRVNQGGTTVETLYLDDLYEETGAGRRRHIYDRARRQATVSSGRTTHQHYYDAQGNVVLLIDSAGAIARRAGYLPSGEQAFAEGPAAQEIGFLGRGFEAETGLVYVHAR